MPGKIKQDVNPRDIAAELVQHRIWLSTRFSACFSFSFFSSIIRVRENTELEECTVTEFVVEKEDEEEVVIPEEEDDTWMLDIDQDDALLLAAACDNNGEHGMHSKYDCFRGPPEDIIHSFTLMS